MNNEQKKASKNKPSKKYGLGALHKGLSSSNYKELTKLYGIAKIKRLDSRLKELCLFNI